MNFIYEKTATASLMFPGVHKKHDLGKLIRTMKSVLANEPFIFRTDFVFVDSFLRCCTLVTTVHQLSNVNNHKNRQN